MPTFFVTNSNKVDSDIHLDNLDSNFRSLRGLLEASTSSWRTYQYYEKIRDVDENTLRKILSAHLDETLSDPDKIVLRGDSSALILNRRKFDCDHYQVNTWKISSLISGSPIETKKLLLTVESEATTRAIQFVSIDINEEDVSTRRCLESLGYYLSCSRKTAILYQDQSKRNRKPKELLQIRNAKQQDIRELQQLARETMVEPSLERDSMFRSISKRCDRSVYIPWINNIFSGERADYRLIATKDSVVKAFFCIKKDQIFNMLTERSINDHSGMAFAARNCGSLFFNLLDRVPSIIPELEGFVSESHSDNKPLLNYYQRRHFELLGTRLIFHKIF